jgi:type IV pilus assembly protein PilM
MFPFPSLKFKSKRGKDKFSAGLDIGAHSVKLVILKSQKDTAELCGFNIEPAELDAAPLLRKITENNNIKSVNISVSGSGTLIRYINFPRMNDGELKQALKFEAQKHIPFSINEVDIDACILKDNLPDNKMLILLAAVKKEFINQRMKVIEEAGLKLNIIDVDSAALVNAFNFNCPEYKTETDHRAIALLNIGATVSNLTIVEDGVPRLSRDIYIAGNSCTQKLADYLGIEFKVAENFKINELKNNPEDSGKVIEAIITSLANESRISFDYFESQSASSVSKIFLSGGGSRLFSLKDTLMGLLGVDVEYWDPMKRLKVPEALKGQKTELASSQLAVAVGLALRK